MSRYRLIQLPDSRRGPRSASAPGGSVPDSRRVGRWTANVPVGEAREVIFEVPAFRGVEQLDVTAISRGANDVIASTATGSLTLTRTAAGALSILMIPLDTAAGRGLEELVDADVDVYARPTWTTDESEFEVVDGVARVTRAFFKYLLVRPVPEDDARGIDPLRPVRSARGLSLSRRRLLLA